MLKCIASCTHIFIKKCSLKRVRAAKRQPPRHVFRGRDSNEMICDLFLSFSHVRSQGVMSIDSSLWPPFHQAKDALFTALLNRCQGPPARVFSAPPSQRHVIRTQVNENISALLELERELEVIQREFKQAYEMVSQQRAAAESCLWPIGALPFDVIREIALYTVEGRHDHRQILNLSHVSKQWREAVLSISWLFTEANWDGWSPLLIDTWCSRAGPHLLKVYLPRRHFLGGASGSSRFELLQKLSTQVGKLEVVVSPRGGETVNRATNGLFELQMPSLQYLEVTSTNRMSEFTLKNVPMLRVLELTSLDTRIPSPLTNVTHLRCHAPRYRDTDIFSGLPNLQHLALEETYRHAGGSLIDGMGHPIILSSLISLEVRWEHPQQLPNILSFFGSFLLPNLRSLVLHDVQREYCIALLQSLV